MINIKGVLLLSIFSGSLFSLELNKQPPLVVLSDKNGGYISGGAWSSDSLKGKVNLVLYMDPDQRKLSQKLIDTIKQSNFNNNFKMVAIVNLKATWLPDFAIEKKLKSKQKELKNTVYVKDKTKYMVRSWGLKDDDVNELLFNKQGKLIYQHSGKITQQDLDKLVSLIQANL
jgi:predicted transcriptional regulator